MAIHVMFDPTNKTVAINGILYAQDVLKQKARTKTETQILIALQYCIDEEPGDEDIDNGEDDEMYRLVQSDMYKNDNHSLALVSNYRFWE